VTQAPGPVSLVTARHGRPTGLPRTARSLWSVPDVDPRPAPPPLVVAAGLAAVEAFLLMVYGVLEAAHVHSDRAAMGVTTTAFLEILGLVLLGCGWSVLRGRAWARSPIMVAQLIFLGLAWSFRGGATTWVAIGLGLVAVLVLAGLLHPASVDALSEGPEHRRTDQPRH
jgi:hypothetical protein